MTMTCTGRALKIVGEAGGSKQWAACMYALQNRRMLVRLGLA